ncbi:MAG: hypothetical protein JOZ46_12175 [Candidatus Dormibacteraeota bacterium]|nr:hypothetical protein [Candidatus Dormibacteraeota bacterium]MBV9526557.1 hypothetical protein [Candidatus Dormibacteraeota bacterium]
MADAVPYAVVAVVAIVVWFAGLTALDVFTPPDVRAWRRLATLRRFRTPSSRLERAVEQSPALKRLQHELDLQRLLAMADRRESPLSFIAKTAALTFGVLAALLTADSLARAVIHDWPLPPWLLALAALSLIPLSLLELRRTARRTREASSRALGDMMMVLAVMTDSRGFQLDEAVATLARCESAGALAGLLDRRGFERLVSAPYRSTIEQYRLVGDAYQIPELLQLADAAETAHVGISERDVYTRLALSTYRERLATARMRAARAKTLVTLPVAAMLIPLLLIIGAPAFSAISGGIQGG